MVDQKLYNYRENNISVSALKHSNTVISCFCDTFTGKRVSVCAEARGQVQLVVWYLYLQQKQRCCIPV